MALHSIEYLEGRRNAKAASGGKNYARHDRVRDDVADRDRWRTMSLREQIITRVASACVNIGAPMGTPDYLTALERLGLTPACRDTAETLGLSLRQCQRYASGHAIPGPLAKLLRMMIALAGGETVDIGACDDTPF
jgi:hypothetical protein